MCQEIRVKIDLFVDLNTEDGTGLPGRTSIRRMTKSVVVPGG